MLGVDDEVCFSPNLMICEWDQDDTSRAMTPLKHEDANIAVKQEPCDDVMRATVQTAEQINPRESKRLIKNRRSATVSRFRRLVDFKRVAAHRDVLQQTLEKIVETFKDEESVLLKLRPLVQGAKLECDKCDALFDDRLKEMRARPDAFLSSGELRPVEMARKKPVTAVRKRLRLRIAQRLAEKE